MHVKCIKIEWLMLYVLEYISKISNIYGCVLYNNVKTNCMYGKGITDNNRQPKMYWNNASLYPLHVE